MITKEDFINKYNKDFGCTSKGEVCWCEICVLLETAYTEVVDSCIEEAENFIK